MNKQEQDLDTGNWYWTDEYVESLEAENKLMKEKALTSFNCFWNGGWYTAALEVKDD